MASPKAPYLQPQLPRYGPLYYHGTGSTRLAEQTTFDIYLSVSVSCDVIFTQAITTINVLCFCLSVFVVPLFGVVVAERNWPSQGHCHISILYSREWWDTVDHKGSRKWSDSVGHMTSKGRPFSRAITSEKNKLVHFQL